MRESMWLLVLTAGLCTAPQARAEVRLHTLFQDGMVLQQAVKVPVWGTADPNEPVSVHLETTHEKNGVTITVSHEAKTQTDAQGRWLVYLGKLQPGGPFPMRVTGKNNSEKLAVYVGDVWVCSGQSNMEWSLAASSLKPKDDIANSKNSMIRLFKVPKVPSGTPRAEFGKDPKSKDVGKWMECGPDTVASFSGVGYYFGRDLQKARNVPIGLIQSAWGGTAAERWTRKWVFDTIPELKGLKGSDLYNGMIAPLQPFAIKGVIWYQGESNAGKAQQYQTLFPAMIQQWRDDWRQGNFPFLFVQLAPWDNPKLPRGQWAELREAQLLTLAKAPNTAMAVITDCGDRTDIHPKPKEPVGARLALAARALAYGEKIVYSGPVYDSMKRDRDKVILHFKHTGGGLVAKGERLLGFTIAGTDGKFVDAQAEIVGELVVVFSKDVAQPTAVRYGWENYPEVNLYNQEGLPATPFRTDVPANRFRRGKPAGSRSSLFHLDP